MKRIYTLETLDTWHDRTYIDWIVEYNGQGRRFYGYRRNPQFVEQEARQFFNSLPDDCPMLTEPYEPIDGEDVEIDIDDFQERMNHSPYA